MEPNLQVALFFLYINNKTFLYENQSIWENLYIYNEVETERVSITFTAGLSKMFH
jgi:hypothetical protein